MQHKKTPIILNKAIDNNLKFKSYNKKQNFDYQLNINNLYTMKSILLLICGIVLFQVLVSAVIYPILNIFGLEYNALITLFILIHVLLIPVYMRFGFSLIGLAYNKLNR